MNRWQRQKRMELWDKLAKEGLAEKHEFRERQSPIAVVITCTCGWSHRERRSQNAWARTSKLDSAMTSHLEKQLENNSHKL